MEVPGGPVDVAMFIDWENMHGYIRGKANISALREMAESYGRLVLTKAYADWREGRFMRDSQVLYQIGFEPVYVPSGNKNNADVKLATDCIDCAYRHPNINTIVLVSGDGDFVHVVNKLRPLGKRVIVIAQSNNASARLGDLVDRLLIYDKDVEPAGKVESQSGKPGSRPQAPKDASEVFRDIVDIIKEEDGSPILLTQVKSRLINRYGEFDQRAYGFEKFKVMMLMGAQEGHFTLHTAGLRDWLTLPQGDSQITHVKMPDELEDVFEEIVEIIKASKRRKTLLAYIKHKLKQKYGGFDESVYGYKQFKQLMHEGAALEHFQLGVDENQADYAILVETRDQNGEPRLSGRAHPDQEEHPPSVNDDHRP
jgi:uncharacterized protein (TIGR00288 family)